MTTPEISTRRLSNADRHVCERFDCGDEPFEREVNEYIQTQFWNRGQQEHALIAYADDGTMFGFGTWRHRVVSTTEGPEETVGICFFGVSTAHKGARNAANESCADKLYAALEADALAHPETHPDMPIDLLCDVDNERGLRFWRRQGFKTVGYMDHYHYMRR